MNKVKLYEEYVWDLIWEAEDEDKQSTDRSPIDNDAIETGLKNKSEETGVPIGILFFTSFMEYLVTNIVNSVGPYIFSIFTLLKMSKGLAGLDALIYLQRFVVGGETEDEVRKSIEAVIQSRSSDKTVQEICEVKLPAHRLITENFYLEKRWSDLYLRCRQ